MIPPVLNPVEVEQHFPRIRGDDPPVEFVVNTVYNIFPVFAGMIPVKMLDTVP